MIQIIRFVLCAIFSASLYLIGHNVTTPQFWILSAIFCAYGIFEFSAGLSERK